MTGAALATARRARRLRPSREVALPALTFLAFALLPLFAPRYRFAVAAVALDLQVGYAGLISFGHVAFAGLGAYAVGILSA